MSPGAPLVLTYHSIAAGPPPLCIEPERFAAQLDGLAAAGLRALPLADVVAALESGGPVPANAYSLTFDDAYRDFAESALPILERRGLPATLFATASRDRGVLPGGIGAPLLALEELAALPARGVDVGGHSISHVDLTTLSDADLERELGEGRAALEACVGRPVEHFAYPFGAFDARVRAAAAQVYRSACTTQLARPEVGCDPFAIPRVDAHYLRSPVLRFLLGRGRPDPYLRLRRRLRQIRGSEPAAASGS